MVGSGTAVGDRAKKLRFGSRSEYGSCVKPLRGRPRRAILFASVVYSLAHRRDPFVAFNVVVFAFYFGVFSVIGDIPPDGAEHARSSGIPPEVSIPDLPETLPSRACGSAVL